MSNNFGSASIGRHDGGKLHIDFFSDERKKTGTFGFMLGLNRPYVGQYFVPYEVGEVYAQTDFVRVNNPNYGSLWGPSLVKGMSCCFGAGGAGKGAGLIIPACLFYAGNIACTDPKGQNAWISAPRRRALGQKVAICDPFGEVNKAYGDKVGVHEQIMRYNPLASIDADALDFPEQVGSIAEAITVVSNDAGGSSGFFTGAARGLIDGIIGATVLTSPPGQATFRKVLEIISMDDPGFGRWCALFVKDHPDTYPARKLARFADMAENRTNQGIKSTAQQQTDFLHSEQLLRYMEPAPGEETFSFSELATGKLSAFFVLPATQMVTQARWNRMMINQSLKAVMSARAKQETPTLFLLDEAGTSLGHLSEVETAYGLARGLNITLWSFYQDLSQLKRDYPASWETFIANSAVIEVLDAKDNTTCEYFSSYMGNKTVESKSSGVSQGPPVVDMVPGSRTTNITRSENTGEMGRPVMTPHEIRTIPSNELIVIFPKRTNATRQFKIEYFRDARFNGLYRMDPNEQTSWPNPVVNDEGYIPMEGEQQKPGLGSSIMKNLGGNKPKEEIWWINKKGILQAGVPPWA